MPHFVIDCSDTVLTTHREESIIEAVHIVANQSGLFDENDIKVRLNPFQQYRVGNKKQDFIHVFANIMEGRRQEQKAALSNAIVTKLTAMFPKFEFIAMNVRDFEKATYCNREMLAGC